MRLEKEILAHEAADAKMPCGVHGHTEPTTPIISGRPPSPEEREFGLSLQPLAEKHLKGNSFPDVLYVRCFNYGEDSPNEYSCSQSLDKMGELGDTVTVAIYELKTVERATTITQITG